MMEKIRSLLFVPADEKRLSKIGQTNADAYILDLEDSIASEDKDCALQRTIEFLKACTVNNLFVRINKHRIIPELSALKHFNIGFMLPKIESDADYVDAVEVIKEHKTIALIETPCAFLNANAIASLPWISALAFGAEDFTVAAKMSNDVNTLAMPKQLLALTAKANHKMVYDTPCFNLHDDEALRIELQQAVKLGFNGKLAIHPQQVDAINKAFRLSDPEYIRNIIDVYESSGNAVCEIDGRVYEKVHIDRFQKMLIEDI